MPIKKIDIENFDKRILTIRKQKNLTQKSFANLIGVSQNFIGLIERRQCRPSFNFIMFVLKTMQVSADWLLLGKGSMYPQIKEKKPEIKEINEDRAAYGADKSPGFDDELNNLKSHWSKLNDDQKRALMVVLKEMVKNNNEILLEENRKLKDFIIEMMTNQPGEIPSNVVQGLTD
jgi:transcriptional regulator with XRE-family HTH domain